MKFYSKCFICVYVILYKIYVTIINTEINLKIKNIKVIEPKNGFEV